MLYSKSFSVTLSILNDRKHTKKGVRMQNSKFVIRVIYLYEYGIICQVLVSDL